ncbi:spermidine resistance protein [Coemansia nantahalensis]|uniref:Spermidine resistance protein n=1 Tax=Coemansia nantahalensis TaxID=2789366 RepID=A0ACC1K3F2_9FUNG|nr:spermidine resistance protein [Coemansia nantahalensis]
MSGPHAPHASVAGQQWSADATLDNSAAGSPVASSAELSRSSSRATIHSVHDVAPAPAARTDVTVEILMTGLDPERMHSMYLGGASSKEGPAGGRAVERATGIADIYPDAASDSYLFTPCGFSLNGVQGDGYYTIHVTPEQHCSYASFETNIANDARFDLRDPAAIKSLVEQVVAVFGPRKVTVTVFKACAAAPAARQLAESALPLGAHPPLSVKERLAKVAQQLAADMAPPSLAPIDGYRLHDRVLYEFDHYGLRYAYYQRAD